MVEVRARLSPEQAGLFEAAYQAPRGPKHKRMKHHNNQRLDQQNPNLKYEMASANGALQMALVFDAFLVMLTPYSSTPSLLIGGVPGYSGESNNFWRAPPPMNKLGLIHLGSTLRKVHGRIPQMLRA